MNELRRKERGRGRERKCGEVGREGGKGGREERVGKNKAEENHGKFPI